MRGVRGARSVQAMDLALLLAATARCDPRTARRALTEGVGVIATERIREDLLEAARVLGIELPAPSEEPTT